MADKYDRATRSRMMSACRSRGNRSTEIVMISLLREYGFSGWRRHQPVFGRPDFVWLKQKVALFVDGCFWHGCPYCRRPPKTNVVFWEKKIAANKRRDRKVSRVLRAEAWTVLRVRECSLKRPAALRQTLTRVLRPEQT